MKIAIIQFGKKGAGPAITLEMAKALYKKGHIIYYYASEYVENKKFADQCNFNFRYFKTYTSKLTYLKSLIFPVQIIQVIKTIKKDKPDIVYSTMNDMWIPFIFPFLKKILRIKTIHDVGVHKGDDSIVNILWNKTNFKNADAYIILSQKYKSTLIAKGIPKNKIVVIPHPGFDYYNEHGIIKDLNVKSDLLFFGRIDKYKGIDILIEAMQIVIKKYPNVILNIVGNGNMDKYLTKILEMKDNIKVYNRWIKDEEVALFFKQTQVVILPYIHATQSGVIPLAYAFSKPVIATNVGCLDEQVLDGRTGVLISSADYKLLAEAIINMLSNSKKVTSMGIAANNYMKKFLTWDAAAERLLTFILKQDSDNRNNENTNCVK